MKYFETREKSDESVVQVVAEQVGVKPTDVLPDERLSHIGADSADVLEIIMELEEDLDGHCKDSHLPVKNEDVHIVDGAITVRTKLKKIQDIMWAKVEGIMRKYPKV